MKEVENIGIAKIRKLVSLFRKGRIKKKIRIGIMKNKIPPHAERPRDKKRPENTSLIIDDLPL